MRRSAQGLDEDVTVAARQAAASGQTVAGTTIGTAFSAPRRLDRKLVQRFAVTCASLVCEGGNQEHYVWLDGAADRVRSRPLADLYVAHAPDAVRLAFLLTGDAGLAEDLVQDAFARLVGRLRHLRDPAAFGSYLRRTIVNLATSHFRHRRVERSYLEREARIPQQLGNANEALDEAMQAVLLRLPQRQRAAIALRFYEDLSDVQTADILQCSAGTVRSLVSP